MRDLFSASIPFVTLLTAATAQQLPGRDPPTSNSIPPFHHRAWHQSIVLGDYLYIDGGEVTTWNATGEATYIGDDLWTGPSNWTYSIPLTTSWTNSTLALNPISRDGISPVNRAALWPNAEGTAFYLYDGTISWYTPDLAPSSNQFLEFTPEGSEGEWNSAYISPSSATYSTLTTVYNALYAYSSNGLGFALGGRDTALDAVDYVSGLVMYNDSSKLWSNTSAVGFTYSGHAMAGAAHFVPSFGPEGLLFAFGGTSAADQYVSFSEAYMFEPVSKRWARQAVSGDIPAPNVQACVVGLEGDEGTYEIFLYGGGTPGNGQQSIENGAVSVLSLPSFHWHREPNPLALSRVLHTCNIIGNRQMVSVGGTVSNSSSFPSMVDYDSYNMGVLDPWYQGIGVYDLSVMKWKDSYDPGAAQYVTPDVVKAYYRDNDMTDFAWESELVKEWFSSKVGTTHPGDRSDSGGSNVGAIAGGVVGGLVSIGLISALVFFFLRRKRTRSNRRRWDVNDKMDRPESELPDENRITELATKERPQESDATPIYELRGNP